MLSKIKLAVISIFSLSTLLSAQAFAVPYNYNHQTDQRFGSGVNCDVVHQNGTNKFKVSCRNGAIDDTWYIPPQSNTNNFYYFWTTKNNGNVYAHAMRVRGDGDPHQ